VSVDLAPFDLAPFGLAVGHASDEEGATGLTVVRGVDGALRAAGVVIGRATGTRDFGPLDPSHLVGRIDALLFTGGSAYGLDAVGGVMRWMEERGRGFAVGPGVVPIVPGAVVFDLAPLGRFDRRPDAAMAYAATERATTGPVAEGSVGAGTGTTVGRVLGPHAVMKGGVGCAVAGDALSGCAAAALAVVNALGDVRDAEGRIIAGARAPGGGFADARALLARGGGPDSFRDAASEPAGPVNTTLCMVAVNRPWSRERLRQLAAAAAAAPYRRITPFGTAVDGDVIVALSAEVLGALGPHEPSLAEVGAMEALAVQALETAIERAVRLARGRDGIPGLADGA
jgi:L-aminopeptidase/D-esterase-like protein